jgi:hypothetical protein
MYRLGAIRNMNISLWERSEFHESEYQAIGWFVSVELHRNMSVRCLK